MLAAMLAVFIQLQFIFQKLLILSGKIIDEMTAGTFQLDHIVLRHIFLLILSSRRKPGSYYLISGFPFSLASL